MTKDDITIDSILNAVFFDELSVEVAKEQLYELLGSKLPETYAKKVNLDVAQLWDSADATDGYNQALGDTHKALTQLFNPTESEE